jgi:hypothetical protein
LAVTETYHPSLAELAIPRRIAALPTDARGFPVPFFVAIVRGVPDHRVVDPAKLHRVIRSKLCWICGEPLGRNVAFNTGLLGILQRASYEPPSHLGCATFAVKACPFLSRPHAKRRPVDHSDGETFTLEANTADENLGVHAVWVTRDWKWHWRNDSEGTATFDDPVEVTIWRNREPATPSDVIAALEQAQAILLRAGAEPQRVFNMMERLVRTVKFETP